MGSGGGYFPEADADTGLPSSVKVVRVVLFIAAGLTVLIVTAALIVAGAAPRFVGYLIWYAWPGVVGFFVALRIRRPSRVKFWLIIVIAAVYVLESLAAMGQGSPRGITTLIIPVLLLVFVLQKPSRAYFHRPRPASD